MRLTLLAAAAAAALGAATAQASLLVYEGFDYAAGTNNLAGQGAPLSAGGNSGFVLGSTYAAGQMDVTAGSLSYLGFPASVGNKTTANGAGGDSTGLGNTGTNGGRRYGPTPNDPLVDGSTYYYSFLFSKVDASRGYFSALGNPTPFVPGANDYQRGFGIRFENVGNGNTVAAWSPDQTMGTGLAVTSGNTNLIVGKVVISTTGNSVNQIWLNPTDLTGMDPVGTSSIANATWTQTQNIRTTLTGRTNGGGSGWSVDEVRVGTSLADVTVVPEPASLAVLGIAGLALLRRKKV